MYLGARRIRSAGRTSGSIEITLPTDLQVLEGIECRMVVRDGARPEIVLQPDLSEAQALYARLWRMLQVGLAEIGEIGEFDASEFTMALFPPRHWRLHPPLAYSDALAVLQAGGDGETMGAEALSRLLAFMALRAARQLGLEERFAVAFGDATAYLMTGTPAGLGADLERSLAYRAFWAEGSPRDLGSPLEVKTWHKARYRFQHVHRRLRVWQENPREYSQARQKWYRALRVEVGLRSSAE